MKASLRIAVAFGFAAVLAAASHAQPMTDEQMGFCVNEARALPVENQIFACTSAIASGKWHGKNLSWAYVNRSVAYALKGNLDKAAADAGEAIRLDPENAMAFTNRGFAYWLKDDPEHALADFNEAIRLDPSNATALNNRGLIYKERADYTSAIRDYSAAIRIYPDFQEALDNRGHVYFVIGEFDLALTDYTLAIKIKPEDADAVNGRGLVYLAKGDPDRAIADFDEAIRLNPEYFWALNNRGNAYYAKADYTRAIGDYDKAIAMGGNQPLFYFNRGRANYFRGALSDAVRDLDRCAELAPFGYEILWQEIAARRSGLPSRLGQATKRIDMKLWPAPALRLYLGEITPEELRDAAEDPDKRLKEMRLCEADIFLGEFTLIKGKNSEAKAYFKKALDECQAFPLHLADARKEFNALEPRL